MAEVVLRSLAQDRGLGSLVAVESAGTGTWHLGEDIDPRAAAALARHGYPLKRHTARRFEAGWIPAIDVVVAMDRSHFASLRSLLADAGLAGQAELHLFGHLRDSRPTLGGPSGLVEIDDPDVPDPYFGPDEGFDACLKMIEAGCEILVGELESLLERRGDKERSS